MPDFSTRIVCIFWSCLAAMFVFTAFMIEPGAQGRKKKNTVSDDDLIEEITDDASEKGPSKKAANKKRKTRKAKKAKTDDDLIEEIPADEEVKKEDKKEKKKRGGSLAAAKTQDIEEVPPDEGAEESGTDELDQMLEGNRTLQEPEVPEQPSVELKEVSTVETQREINPPFRTDLGIDFSIGLNLCLGGASESFMTGSCSQMEPGIAVGGSVLHRPLPWLAAGINVHYDEYSTEHHHSWGDFYIGPEVRGIWPAGRWEPYIKLSGSYVQSSFEGTGRDPQGGKVDQNGTLRGIAVAAGAGVDYFFLPGLGAGIETRFSAPFFMESCWKSGKFTYCRDTDSKDLDEEVGAQWDPGKSDQAYRLSIGVHAVYYF